MSRPPAAPKIPSIVVVEDIVKRTLSFTREQDAQLSLYAEYFHTRVGKKPRSNEDVALGLVLAWLDGDAAFHKWRDAAPHAPTKPSSPLQDVRDEKTPSSVHAAPAARARRDS